MHNNDDLDISKLKYIKSVRKKILAVCAILLIILTSICLFQDIFVLKNNIKQVLRRNDPIIRQVISVQAETKVKTVSDYVLEDDKSLYDLNNAGEISTFYLEVFEKNDYNITSFENPDIAENLVLPGILREGTKGGISLSNKFGSSAISPNVSIEVKGVPNENRKYHNFKIRLKETAGLYDGQAILNLKKAYGKPTKVEEKFAFDIFSSIPQMMSLRTKFVHLYVKNNASPSPDYESYGLYILVEQPDENYFVNRSLDSSANMYQARNFNFTLKDELVNIDNPNYNKKDFEEILDIKQGDTHIAVLEMISAVNDMEQDIDEIIEKYFDRDNIFTYMALNVILGNEEMATKGFMLYKPMMSSVWFILPGNMSETMLSALDQNHYKVMNTGLSQFSGNLLYERILSKQENVDELFKKIDELMLQIDKDTVKNITNSYIPVLAKYFPVNPDRGILKDTPEKVINSVDNYYNILTSNVNEFKMNLYYPEKLELYQANRVNNKIVLNWQESSFLMSKNYKYTIEISSTPDFSSIIYEKDNIQQNFCEVEKSIFVGDINKFYWRVKTTNYYGNSSGSSNVIKLEDESRLYGVSSFVVIK